MCNGSNWVPSSNRPFYLKIYHVKSSSPNSDNKELIADFECLSCVHVYFVACLKWMDFLEYKYLMILMENAKKIGSNRSIGKVIEPFSCGATINIYGNDRKIRWKVYGEYIVNVDFGLEI